MRTRTTFILLAVVGLSLFECGKKEKKGIVVRSEGLDVEVEVPEVVWGKSLAVLPLEGEYGSPEDEIVSRVMTEGIVKNLSRSEGLRILSSPSEDWLEKGEMEVNYLLKGRVEKKGEYFQLALRVVDAKKDSNLWTGSYEEDFQSLFTVEENASGSVAQALGLDIDDKKGSVATSVSSQALDGYLEGKSHLAGGTRDETDLAVQKFKDVLRLDSTFTLAYLGLAESYLQIIQNQWDRNLVWLRLAQEAARQSLRLDVHLAEGYLRLGQVYLAFGDFKKAEGEFRRALSINTSMEEAWIGLGKVFIHYGLYEPCLEVYEKALALNPAAGVVSLSRVMILAGLKRYGKAEEEIRKALRFHPKALYTHSFLALLLYYQDRMNDAFLEVNEGLKGAEYLPFSHAVLAMIYAKQGKLDDALAELELEVKPHVHNDGSLATAVAAVHSLLNQNGQAVQWLEKAVSWGYKEYPWLANDPNFESLREDARFVQLMEGMKEEWEERMRRYSVEESTS